MKKKWLALLLALVFCTPAIGGCGGGDDLGIGTVTEHALDLPQARAYEEDYRAFPRAQGETQKTVDWLDLSGSSLYEWFFASALQGIVNRENPCVYLIRNGSIVQDKGAQARYWLEKLDESYGEGVYTKNPIPSLGALLVKYRDKVSGAVLYPDRLLRVGSLLVNQGAGPAIYGDMAIANYTTMLCAQKDALPVTQTLLAEMNAYLTQQGKSPLRVLGDTTEFLSGEPGGALAESGSREVWHRVYRTALDKIGSGEWTVNRTALGHNGTWNGAWYDYIFQQKLFTYNRIIDEEATQTERAIEKEILDLTPKSTAVLGVWHLVAGFDEVAMLRTCDDNDKFFVVTFGTYNISWSCGLPRTQMREYAPKLTYDPEKVYLSFSLSESDNNTYTYYYMWDNYDSDLRGSFGMTWQVNQAMFDLNPNILAYMNATFTEKDGYAFGEAGIGYARDFDTRTDFMGFLGLTDKYSADMNAKGGVNTMYNRVTDAMSYIEATENLKSITMGYVGSDTAEDSANSGLTYYYHDTPIFANLGYESTPSALLDLRLDGGTFVNLRMAGFSTTMQSLKSVIDRLPENYEVVTQSQLIDLYKQKMAGVSENVNQAAFTCSMNETESAFLWYTDDKNKYNRALVVGQEEYRYGMGNNELVYRFRLDPASEQAVFDLAMSGEYDVEFSTDQTHWTRAARYLIGEGDTTYAKRRPVRVTLPESMAGKTVYLRISDPTPEDGVGYRLYRVSMTTQAGGLDSALDLESGYDTAYVVSGEFADGGRTGEVVYRLPFAESVTQAIVTAEVSGTATLEISVNGTHFYPLEANLYDRSAQGLTNYYYANVDSIAGTVYLKVKTTGTVARFRILPVGTRNAFSFSPCNSETDREHLVYGTEVKRAQAGASSNARLSYGEALCYVFRIGEGVTEAPVLTVLAGGMFKLEISNDGKTWQTLRSVQVGENVSDPMNFDLSGPVRAGNFLYFRFSKSANVGANAVLYYITLK